MLHVGGWQDGCQDLRIQMWVIQLLDEGYHQGNIPRLMYPKDDHECFSPTFILVSRKGHWGISEQSKLTKDGLTNNLLTPVAHIWTEVSRLGWGASPWSVNPSLAPQGALTKSVCPPRSGSEISNNPPADQDLMLFIALWQSQQCWSFGEIRTFLHAARTR